MHPNRVFQRFGGKIRRQKNARNDCAAGISFWCRLRGLNSRPSVYKTAALSELVGAVLRTICQTTLNSMMFHNIRSTKSGSIREPVDRTHCLYSGFDIPQIDGRSQELDLVCLAGFINVDVPRSWSTVGAIVPAISPFLQLVFQIERGLLRPNAYCLAPSPFKQDC